MEMMNGLASCLIKVRQLHIGFPSLFSHYPEGMKQEELTEIHRYVQDAMDQPREIPEASGSLRRVVIGTGKYLILGISGYAQYLAAEIQDIPYQLVDFTGRGCPGFIGFVWNLETTPVQQIIFPSLSVFGAAFHELILEHWEDSINSVWAYDTRAGIALPYKYTVSGEPLPTPIETVALNHNKRKIFCFDSSKENDLIHQTISEAIQKQIISLCTDLYFDEEGSGFLNMTADLKGGPVVCIENARSTPAKSTPKPEPVAETEQCLTSIEPVLHSAERPDYAGVSEDNDEKGGFQFLTKGIFSAIEEPKSVILKFKYCLCDAAQQIISRFLRLLTAAYRNYGYDIDHKGVYLSEKDSEVVYLLKVIFPAPVLLEDFKEICKGILEYLYKQNLVDINKNGRFIVKDSNRWREFRVFVAYNHIPRTQRLLNENEILLASPIPAEKRNATRIRVSRESKKENSNPDSQIPTGSDSLIQQIKQNNSGRPVKPQSDDDPFKL